MVTVNVRHFSVKCGVCLEYQTLSSYRREGELNVYVYECENAVCAPEGTRTLIEVHHDVDEFANRDPNWRGGRRHGGAEEPEAGEGA